MEKPENTNAMKEKLHSVRIKNMELRREILILKRENALIISENESLKDHASLLVSKCSADCETILAQIKELESL